MFYSIRVNSRKVDMSFTFVNQLGGCYIVSYISTIINSVAKYCLVFIRFCCINNFSSINDPVFNKSKRTI